MSIQTKGKQGWLENAFVSSKWDSRIKSANTTKKELWLGYVIGPYGMLVGQSIVNSYFNQYLTDILGLTVSKGAWIVLSSKLDAPAPCRLDAPDFDVARWGSADCLHQHQQVI